MLVRFASLLILGCLPPFLTSALAEIRVQRLATGLDQPLYLTTAPGDDERLFVVEKGGSIEVVNRRTGVQNTRPFLNLSREVSTDSERGLLGLAFHPEFAANGRFYVNLTNRSGSTEIRQYQVSDDPDFGDTTSATQIISFSQPFSNHNGGWIDFGPDGYLYAATGDGGSGNDPQNNGQNLNSPLGKMLRLDVNGDDFAGDALRNYAIPADNPFAADGDDQTLAEIWAYGLRNPWRNSFDSATGDFYIADVGQNVREEINFQLAGAAGGENYGWRLREGALATPSGGVGGPPPVDNVEPVYEYAHGNGGNQGNSVTGGYVYHGPIAELQNQYIFGDYVNNRIWSIEVDRETGGLVDGSFTDWTTAFRPDVGSIGTNASFGEDNLGNLYIIDINGGEVFAVIPEPSSAVLCLLGLLGLNLTRRSRRANCRASSA